MSIPSSMSEARDLGEPRYFTGRKCKNGHIAERYAKTGACLQCHAKWAKDHRDSGAAEPKTIARNKAKRLNEPWYYLYYSARDKARKNGVRFDLVMDDVKSIWPEDNRCPITGMFFYVEGREGGRNYRDSPSIDKLRPERGYVRGNIAIISMRANHMKNDVVDPALFRKLADWLEAKLAE